MMDDQDRTDSENVTQDESISQEVSPGTGRAAGEEIAPDQSDSHLLPFSKPYHDYFDAVYEAHRALHRRAGETYMAYVKAARDAMGARNAEAHRSATEKFYRAWTELTKPADIIASVSRAFDAYHREMRSAFASGATEGLGPGCFALVAHSMVVVASHRMAYRGV
jgi:hypothetical protein